MHSSQSQVKAPWLALLITACYLLFFLALRTKNYASVDGAVRCLKVFFHGRQFHSNNHMLYPIWVELWAKLNSLVGNRARDAFDFIRISQAMNCFMCAVSAGCVYFMIASVARMRAALLGSLLFAFSSAVILQATTSDEAPGGLFFAVVAVTILSVGLRTSRAVVLLAGGFLMSLALASYEAAGTVVGIAILMCCFWPVAASAKPMAVFPRLAITGAGSVLGVVVVYGWAYSSQGVPVAKMPARFLDTGGNPGVYTGLDILPSKILNTSFGFIQWLFSALPDDYSGIRALVHHSHRIFWVSVMLAAFTFVGAVLFLSIRGWRSIGPSLTRAQLLMVLAIFVFVLIPVFAWGPNNPKMWLLPLACLSFGAAVAWDRGKLPPLVHRIFTACLLVCLGTEAARNLPFIIREHTTPTPHLKEAAEVGELVRPDDWVVNDFDETSALWSEIWGYQNKTLTLPASTVAEATQWLSLANTEVRAGHGRLFFLGLLEAPRAQWDPFMGARVKIPYEFLDVYRRETVTVKRLGTGDPPMELRQYVPRQ